MNKPQKSGVSFSGSELGQRVLSAIVLLIITIFISWIGGVSFALMCAVLSALLFYEWQAIVRTTPFDNSEALLTAGFVVMLLSALFGIFIYGLVAYVLIGLALEMTSTAQEEEDVRWIGLGGIYCIIPAVALPLIREDGGFALLMFVFLVVWATDIAAYFAGRQFGGPKLFPAVSPKKTWSGACGGMLGALAIAFLFNAFVEGFSGWAPFFLAALLSAVSQMGDLFESWVKRWFDVKDSSQLIPGHGGFLDRVDGLVAAAVPVAVFLAL